MKTIGLVAHDSRKMEMAEWVNYNRDWLKKFHLVGTEGTAQFMKNITGLDVESLGHGPEGGDIFLSYKVLSDQVQALMFFIDVENPHGHEHDIQTLIRICVVKNIPLALNRATADYFISSRLLKPE